MGSNPIPSIVVMGCDILFLNCQGLIVIVLISSTTISKISSNIPENIQAQKLEKDIEVMIEGSLPYYKSIFKQMMLVNLQNAHTASYGGIFVVMAIIWGLLIDKNLIGMRSLEEQ